MTFKHVKFEDSPTMRALEKVAKEKGLVKPEPLKKRASVPKKPDYTPTGNLMENVLKLCAGLRNQGLVKEAAELETNYLNYKSAQTLYETSKEKGEDLIQSAHPKGSHKLEGVEGNELAVIEDILDQHMKLIQIVDKKPTGKLSTAQAIRAVKKALGISLRERFEQSINNAIALCKEVIATEKDISEWSSPPEKLFRDSLTSKWSFSIKGHLESMISNLQNELTQPSSEDNVKKIGRYMNTFNYLIGTAENISGANKQKYLSKANSILGESTNLLKMMQGGTPDLPDTQDPKPAANAITIPEVTIQEGPLGPIHRQINSLKQQLNTWSTYRSISGDAQAMQWIREEIASLDDIKARMDKVPDNDESEKEAAPNFQRELADEQRSIAEFKAGWVDPH